MPRKTIKVKYGVEMYEPRRIPPWLKLLGVIAVIVGGLYGFYSFIVWIFAPTEEDMQMIEATPYVVTATPSPTEVITPTPTVRPSPTINPDMSYDLMNVVPAGEHVKAWVYIPGLGLDTVVLQWKDNYYFQLYDLNLNSNDYGSVYFDYRSDFSYIREAGNIVIYGYNNIGGRQLKSLTKYAQEEYFDYNTLIVLETLYGKYDFRLFSVHIEDDDEEYTSPVAQDSKREFIDLLLEKSMFDSEYVPTSDCVILTFSIDVESSNGNRMLIHAFYE